MHASMGAFMLETTPPMFSAKPACFPHNHASPAHSAAKVRNQHTWYDNQTNTFCVVPRRPNAHQNKAFQLQIGKKPQVHEEDYRA
eukprot:3492505-Amphidinium_carterae.1